MERDEIMRDRDQISDTLMEERKKFRGLLADKEREKIQSMDSMAREMSEKFREMRGGLMAVHK